MDIVLITPNNAKGIYQGLSDKLSAIEPPTWALMLAEGLRKNSFSVKIIDTLGWNTYAAMALPGRPLHEQAKKDNIKLPKDYEEYSFLSYNSLPLANKNLKNHEILNAQDQDFIRYFSSEKFQNKLNDRFGQSAVDNVNKMLKTEIKRKLIDDAVKSGYVYSNKIPKEVL